MPTITIVQPPTPLTLDQIGVVVEFEDDREHPRDRTPADLEDMVRALTTIGHNYGFRLRSADNTTVATEHWMARLTVAIEALFREQGDPHDPAKSRVLTEHQWARLLALAEGLNWSPGELRAYLAGHTEVPNGG